MYFLLAVIILFFFGVVSHNQNCISGEILGNTRTSVMKKMQRGLTNQMRLGAEDYKVRGPGAAASQGTRRLPAPDIASEHRGRLFLAVLWCRFRWPTGSRTSAFMLR
jgi:hypothetical protein